MSPWAVTVYLLGGAAPDGTVIMPKYIGSRRLIEVAVATLPRAPRFYGLTTADGVPYAKIALLHAGRVLASTVLQTCTRYTDLSAGLEGCDVIMMLRIQKERMQQADLPEGEQYFQAWGLTQQRLKRARPDAIVMHPQPMNRGIEIASDVADGAQSVIRDQVRNGVAVRMAVLAEVLAARGGGNP